MRQDLLPDARFQLMQDVYNEHRVVVETKLPQLLGKRIL